MHPNLSLVFLASIFILSPVFGLQLIGSFTQSDLSSIINKLYPYVTSNKIDKQYHSVLGISSQRKLEKIECDKVSKPSSIEETFYHMSLLKLVECPLPSFEYTLESVTTPKDLFFYMIVSKKFGKKFDEKQASQLIKAYSEGNNNGSWLTYVFACINELFKTKNELTAHKTIFDQLKSKLVSYDQFAFLESGTYNTALAFEYLESFCTSTSVCIDEDLKVKIINQLYKQRNSLEDVKSVIKSIQILKKFANANPKYLTAHSQISIGDTFSKPILINKNEKSFKIYISPLWMGNNVPKSLNFKNFVLRKRFSKDETAMTVKSVDCKPEDGKLACVVHLNSELPQPGSYMAILPTDLQIEKFYLYSKGSNLHIPFVINGELSFSTAIIREFEHSNMINEMNVVFPTENMMPVTLKETSKITITLTMKENSLKPTQVFALLTAIDSDIEIITTIITSHMDKNEFMCTISRNIINQELGDYEGKIDLKFIAGGPGIAKGMKWNFGSIKVQRAYNVGKPYWNETWEDVSKTMTKSSAGSKTSIINLKKKDFTKPELFHTFRKPEKRAHPLISNVFSCICAGTIVILLLGWKSIGFNFSNFPCSIFTLTFHGGMLGIFYLYYQYWISFTIFTTMKYFAVLSIITYYSGFKTLRMLADKRSG